MKIFLTIACLFLPLCAASARNSDFVLPGDYSLALPADGSIKEEWIAPPLAESVVRKAVSGSLRFRMHPKGAVWVLNGQRSVADLASGMLFSSACPVNDFVFLDDGNLLLLGDKALGFIPPLDAAKFQPQNPVLPFQPIIGLPAEKCSLASDGKKVFVYGFEPGTKQYAVFELLKDFSGWARVFVSAERVTAVCSGSDVLHVACGRQVFRMKPGEKEGKLVFSHPLETVTGLAWQPGVGLFYSTNSGVGLVAGAGFEFMKCAAAQLMVRDDALYVFLPDSLGVLRLKNTERLVRGQRK